MPKGLGRGLDSLIPKKVNIGTSFAGDAVVDVISPDEKDRVIYLNPNAISTNPYQPRKRFDDQHMDELVDSIREFGVIQPLIVTHHGDIYELIAGERRLRASRILKLEKIPVLVRDADSQEKLEIALIENLQRENLNPVETALSYRKLMDEFGLSQDDLAKKVGKARPSVANSLRILNLPEEVQLALIDGKITESHAKIITGLETPEKQLALFRKITINQLTVDSTAKESRIMGGTKLAKVKINYEDKNRELVIREFFKAKAEIKRSRQGGQIIIHFFGDEELRGIIERLK
jgi:ParB family chromosome partitioning protein